MRIIEAIKHKGTPFEIPDCSRDELPTFFKQMGYKVGAEIGVYKAEFIEKFLKAGLKMYAVDPWGILPEYPDTNPNRIDRQQFLYKCALRVLKPYDNCVIIRKTSMEAVKDFEVESLDFVYIDGNHKFRYIAEDIYEWTKRVKRGGIVSGHDYFDGDGLQIEVKPVVDAYVKVSGIKNLYTFGRLNPDKVKSKNDKYHSWMFFKK